MFQNILRNFRLNGKNESFDERFYFSIKVGINGLMKQFL